LAENSVINNEKTFFFSGPVDRKSYFFGKICTLLTIICIIFFLMLMIGMIGKAIYPFHQGNYASYQLGSLQLTQYYCGLFLCLLSGIITGVSLKPYSKNDAASIVIFFILFIANVCVALMIQPGSGSTGQPNNAPKLIFDISTLWMMLILFGLSFIIFVFAFLSFIRKDVKI
jgi:ABC-type transport system involved in multi-copper enzyme maturation permease subunit